MGYVRSSWELRMRHYFKNDSRPKSVARAIGTELAKYGHGISHSDSLRLSARFYHYRNWSDLLANLGKHPPSQDDREAGETVAEARFTHHVRTLVDYGIDSEIAAAVVRKIGPTSSGGLQRLGREELWITDAAVASYLDGVAVRLAAEAVEVVPERHGTWLGFRAHFEGRSLPQDPSFRDTRMRNGGTMLFGVSYDGKAAILRENDDIAFQKAVDQRMTERRSGTRDDWDFLDNHADVSVLPEMSEGARIISEVFSRLHLPSMRAMRCLGVIREGRYERAVASDRVRTFLHRYPSLADHCFWSLKLPKEKEHIGSSKWIEGSDPDIALMAMLTRGNLPSGEALAKAKRVAEGLRDYAITSDGNDVFSIEALEALAHLGPEAIPRSKTEMKYLIRSAEDVSSLASNGMDATRSFDGFPGTWNAFHQAIKIGKPGNHFSRLASWWPDTFVYLICSAFGQTYGIDPDLLYDENFSYAVLDRIGPVMMSRMSMIDIAALGNVIEANSAEISDPEQSYPTVAEADELAALFTLPMPDAYHGKSCVEILRQAGYEPDALAGMLKLEPDLTFDDRGLPVMEKRFEGLDPSTYAVAPLELPGHVDVNRTTARRPLPMPPPEVPTAPPGWIFKDGEFKPADDRRSARIRWSDGTNELKGSGPGWYADRGLGHTPLGAEPRCPVRLGRFDTPAHAAAAIMTAKGYNG